MSERDLVKEIEVFETLGPEACLELLHHYFNGPMSRAAARSGHGRRAVLTNQIDQPAASPETRTRSEPEPIYPERPLLALDIDRALSRKHL